MDLECLKGIITDNLAIQIDLTQLKSWNLNPDFTAFSLTKWAGAVSDNINLIDFGLTEFDNGRTNLMWTGITLTPSDTLFSMYRIGYNNVINPSTGNTSGYTATTAYSGYTISGVTGASATTGNYFRLNGGYLQGFFKLDGYNYELLPARYNKGITIETLVYLYPNSSGIFYMMGLRAEDKYNPYFSGETITGITNITTGVTTSFDNYLNGYEPKKILKKGFRSFEDRYETKYVELPATGSTKNNVIAFELTQDKKIAYKYVDNNGLIVTNQSVATVTATGFIMIDMVFLPNYFVELPSLLECEPQRTGKLIFYVNGRAIWIIHEFPEYYFSALSNDKEKQIGVPYSISWGGGSFGLKNSWHYDYQTYVLYKGQDTNYINNNFFVEADPISTECYTAPTGNTYLSGLTFSADSTTFKVVDKCNATIEHPLTVMRIEYTGATGTTGTSANTYFVKFNHPVTVLSNRDYEINLSIFNNDFFKNSGTNRISLLIYGSVDVNILNETQYYYPLAAAQYAAMQLISSNPILDTQEFEYSKNGRLYYGITGKPVFCQFTIFSGSGIDAVSTQETIVTGDNTWIPMKTIFSTKDNTGKQQVYIGLLIESDNAPNQNKPLFINDFTYTAADILVQDHRKDNLLIEENFNSSFIGGIQKLRVYNNALTSPEVLHNALIEVKLNPNLNLPVSKGGRIIYGGGKVTTRYKIPTYIPQESSGSDIRKSIRYKNTDGTYKDLTKMINIKVLIKSRTNPSIELIKFEKTISGVTGWTGQISGWTSLIYVNNTTYDFIVPDTITKYHPNEILFAEIKFQWVDPNDIDNVLDKIIVVNITTNLLDNTIKNY